MSAKRLRIQLATIPMLVLTLGCASGMPTNLALMERLAAEKPAPDPDNIPSFVDDDRQPEKEPDHQRIAQWTAQAEAFERTGQFAQAQAIYQKIIQEDPLSPAAERLLDVIAATELTNARNLPIERQLAVARYFERKECWHVAQGVYEQILLTKPGLQEARMRLLAITISNPTDRFADPEGDFDTQSDVQLANAQGDAGSVDVAQIPPAPREVAPYPAPDGEPEAAQKPVNRVAELWKDKPLGELKATIDLNLPEADRFRESEQQRLTQATPHMVAHGVMEQNIGMSRQWLFSNYEWEAPATRHLPLYFEEPNVERLGYTCGFHWNFCGCESGQCAAECLQPFVSAAHFFGRVPMLPYMMGVDWPNEPIYTLGVDRPGSPVPYRRHLVPITIDGLLLPVEAVLRATHLYPDDECDYE